MLNNQSIKTRQTQNLKAKHISNEVMHTQNKKRERKVIESLGTLFLPHPGRTFPLIKPLNRRWREKTVQVRKEHEVFKKISKGSKRGLKLILVPRCYHAIALLSGKPLVAIWSNMTGSSTTMTEMLLLLFRLLRVSLLSPRVFNIFLLKLRGCS